MSAVEGVTLLLLIFSISPQKEGEDVFKKIGDIARLLVNSRDTEFLHKYKVTGEARIVAVVRVSHRTGLNRILANVSKLGGIDVCSQPIITYESFARNLGVSEELTEPVTGIMQRDKLYWIQAVYNYFGNTTNQFLSSLKRTAERVLTKRNQGFKVEAYKNLAERKFNYFLNLPSPDDFDALLFQFPLTQDFGASTERVSEAIEFLEDYTDIA